LLFGSTRVVIGNVGLPNRNAELDIGAGIFALRRPVTGERGSMKKIQALVKKFKPAKDLSKNAWPLHEI
jgi:hypothetical protein